MLLEENADLFAHAPDFKMLDVLAVSSPEPARSEPVLRALVWPAGGARWASGPGPTPLWPQRRRNLRLDDRGGGQPRRQRKGSGGSWKPLIDALAARPVP